MVKRFAVQAPLSLSLAHWAAGSLYPAQRALTSALARRGRKPCV